jgi:phosphorylcholine metabolism protein LicD
LPSRFEIPSLIKTLHKLIQIFEKEKIDYMLIGGLVLPAYGQIRTTQDIDVAIAIKDVKTLKHMFDELKNQNFEIPSAPTLSAACIYLFDRENAVDVEIWQQPDGVIFDKQLLQKRTRITLLRNLQAWAIGPEDFIINKLARKDRRVQDETDVVSVLVRQKNKLDKKYLVQRAKKFEVLGLLEALKKKVEMT